MSSSQNSTDKPRTLLLAAEGGEPYRLREGADPIDAWIELMEAVEALCPEWPQREPWVGETYRL
jgi:hypothetical protein